MKEQNVSSLSGVGRESRSEATVGMCQVNWILPKKDFKK